MCRVCLKNPCDPRCPNAEQQAPESYATCECCGGPIYLNDLFFKNDLGDCFCEECLNEMTVSEVLELCGESLSVAV